MGIEEDKMVDGSATSIGEMLLPIRKSNSEKL